MKTFISLLVVSFFLFSSCVDEDVENNDLTSEGIILFVGGETIGNQVDARSTSDAFCNASDNLPAGKTASAVLSHGSSDQIINLNETVGFESSLKVIDSSGNTIADSWDDFSAFSFSGDFSSLNSGFDNDSNFWTFSTASGEHQNALTDCTNTFGFFSNFNTGSWATSTATCTNSFSVLCIAY